jgi:ABC-type glycerol-3-phosphate transport system substrate-binding protein
MLLWHLRKLLLNGGKMKPAFFYKVIIIFILIAMIAGCSPATELEPTASRPLNNGKNYSGERNELSVVYYEYGQSLVDAAIKAFRSKNPKVNVNEEILKYNSSDYEENVKAMNSLLTRTLSGNGPDVFIEIKLIKEDAGFREQDYFKGILDSGVYNGKRYLMPVVFGISGFLTTKEVLKANNIDVGSENISWENIVTLAREFAATNKGYDKYLLDPVFEDNILANLSVCGVDYATNTAHFEREQYMAAFRNLKEMKTVIYPSEKDKGFFSSPADYIDRKNVMLSMDQDYFISDILEFASVYTYFKFNKKQELIVIPIQKYSDEMKYPSNILLAAAINSTSRNKKQAYDFIKMLLSSEVCGNVENNNFGYPASKEAYSIMLEKFPEQCEVSARQPKEVLRVIDNAVKNTDSACIEDEHVKNIVYKYFQSYKKNIISLEEAVKGMDDEINHYLCD